MLAQALTSLDKAPRGKFVLLQGEGDFHFICAPLKTHPFHAHIIHTYIQEQGRGEAPMPEKGYSVISTPGWKILGGGHYEVDFGEKVFLLHGKSTAYGKYSADPIRLRVAEILAGLDLIGWEMRLE